MSIKLNGATSGSVELDVPDAIGSDVSLTIPGTTGTVLAAPGSTNITVPSSDGTLDRLERAGNILQVVYQTYNTGVSTSSTSYVNTGLSAAITPTSTSSKILAIVSQTITQPSAGTNTFGQYALSRNGTIIYEDNRINMIQQYAHSTYTITFLDSPATISSTIYSTRMATGTSSYTIEAQHAGLRPSTITLMEVAA